ncbi:MAG: LytTR family DNA-binding domain-containing protein [Kosmotogaceae bacterium]
MKLKAIIVDDEPLAQNVIEQYALKIPELEITEKCNDAICAHKTLQEKQVDLIFLDINMPKLSGISFLKNLKNAPLVIFTTAYSDYALDGYELNAIDYLKKPFSFERFSKAFFKAQELFMLKHKSAQSILNEETSEFIFIKSNKKSYKVKFSEIFYIEGLGDYIQIHLQNDKIVTNLSMKKIFDLLPDNQFYRIHKSFIISIDKIDLVEGNMVKINNKRLPVGNSYRPDFLKFINSNLAD